MNEDITPDGSVSPVFLDPTPAVFDPTIVEEDPQIAIREADERRAAGIAKLVALGLTEDEARAIAGA